MNRAEAREVNRTMSERLLAVDAQPVADGGYALRVLQTRGRRSGSDRYTPVGVVGRAGNRYLVSPDPNRDWVENLVVDGDCLLLARDERDPRHAVRIGGGSGDQEAVEVIGIYLSSMTVPWAIRAFPVPQDAGPDEIAVHLDGIAVFRLDPVG